MRVIQSAIFFVIQLIEQLYLFLLFSWGIVVLIGIFIAMFLITLGFISWLADWQPSRGKRMIIGGTILLFLMQWMAISSPWILSVIIP